MNVRTFLVPIFLICLLAGSATQAKAQGGAASLDIARSIDITGLPGAKGVVYYENGLRLGAVVVRDGAPTLIWSRPLPATPSRLASPGSRGLLEAVVPEGATTKALLFAYLVSPSGVKSAIAGRGSGAITGLESVSLHSARFTVRRADATHVGSVNYRFDTTYSWEQRSFVATRQVSVPDYAKSEYPSPGASVQTRSGNIALLRLEIADTESLRSTGLMNRTSLDPDGGMIFVWSTLVLESFWMENTYIPLSVAFLGKDGTVQEIQNMDALSTVLHTPVAPYQYAIEANLDYFKHAGVEPGDKFDLRLGT